MHDTLYEHQLLSIRQLEELEFKEGQLTTPNGMRMYLNWSVLADPCGAGKTRVVCALLYRELQRARANPMVFHGDWPRVRRAASGAHHAAVSMRCVRTQVPITVIITSLSIQGQWSRELAAWGIEHDVVSCKPKFEHFDQYVTQGAVRQGGLVLLMPVTMVKTWLPLLCNGQHRTRPAHEGGPLPAVHRVVYDEPDSTHIPAMPSLEWCRHVLLVSATFHRMFGRGYPNNMARRHYLYGTLNSLLGLHGMLQEAITVRQDEAAVQAAVQLPRVQRTMLQFRRPQVMRAVEDALPPHLRALAEADATDDLVRALGGVVYDSEQSVVDAVTANLRGALESAQKRAQQAALAYSADGEPPSNAETNARARVAELQARLDALEARVAENIHEPCNVCLEVADEPCLCPKCSANFCRDCLTRWLQTSHSCPMCRGNVSLSTVVYMQAAAAAGSGGDDGPSGAPAAAAAERDDDADSDDGVTLAELAAAPAADAAPRWDQVVYGSRQLALVGAAQGLCAAECAALERPIRGLVYSAAASTMGSMQEYLTDAGFRVAKLTGVHSTRTATLDGLRDGTYDFLIADAGTDAAGLDLPFVQYVLLPYACSDAVRTQIEGRAQRPGRQTPLHVVQMSTV